MLNFSVSRAGYDEGAIAEMLEQSMEYLLYYANQLKDTSGSSNQVERVEYAAETLRKRMEDTMSFLQKKEGEQALQVVQLTLKRDAQQFDSFMKKEYESARSQLLTTNQLLAEKFMAFIEG
jgi:molecular chaperone DnaK (HSP70)